MRTWFHHQPEAQHPKSSAIHKLPADYPIFGSIALKKGSRSSANNDSVCLRLSVAEACHDGSADGRSDPVVLPVQPRTAHSERSFAAPDQSGGDAAAGWTS